MTIKLQDELQIHVSKTIKTANKKDIKMAKVDKMHEPAIPIYRPKKKHEIKLRNGKNIIQKYIDFNFL